MQTQKDDNKSKALTDRISLLEKQKYELDTKSRNLEAKKIRLVHKVSLLEKEKESKSKKLKDLESVKEELTKQVENSDGKPGAPGNDKKSKEELQKLQKENQTLKKEKDDLGKSLKSVEKDLKKNIKDINPNKVQGELRKLAEKIEKNSLLLDASGGYTNGVDGIGSAEASAIKSNVDALQKEYESHIATYSRKSK